MIEESVKRNLNEAYDDQPEEVEAEEEVNAERLVTAFFTALRYDESQYIIDYDMNPCRVVLEYREDWGFKDFEKAIYVLGGDSITVYMPKNQMVKLPLDAKGRGSMIKYVIGSHLFDDAEIGNTLTLRG